MEIKATHQGKQVLSELSGEKWLYLKFLITNNGVDYDNLDVRYGTEGARVLRELVTDGYAMFVGGYF